MLKKEWGMNGDKAGFELARTGHEGGLLKVLRTTARLMRKEEIERQVETLVGLYYQQRSPQERLDDAQEYIERYGHLLPTELTEGSAARLLDSFFRPGKILKEHVEMRRRLKQVGRSAGT